jgi:hypothetical protein
MSEGQRFPSVLGVVILLTVLATGVAIADHLRLQGVEAPPTAPTEGAVISTPVGEAPLLVDERLMTVTPTEDFRTTPGTGAVVDHTFVLGEATVVLEYQPLDGLGGSLVAWAAPSIDLSSVYYTMWEDRRDLDALGEGEVGGIPVIRLHDVATGREEVWRRGAYAVTVSPSGVVAFVQDLDGAYRFSAPNPSAVVVSRDGTDEAWSTETDVRYVTTGWAGETLLAYTVGQGESLQLFAFDGPEQKRLLSDGGLVGAISPDGTEVVIVEPGPDGGSRYVVIGVEDGIVRASFDPATDTVGPIYGANGGDWVGDRIVLPAFRQPAQDVLSGVMVLDRWADQLALTKLVVVSTLTYVPDQVRFTDSGAVWLRAMVTFPDGDKFFEFQCDLEPGACRTLTGATDLRRSAIVADTSQGAKP